MKQWAQQRIARHRFAVAGLLIAAAAGLASCAEERPAYVINPNRSEAPYPVEHPYYTVTVRPGDSISKIAERCGTTVAVIADLNELDVSQPIRPGHVLDVPSPAREDTGDVPRPTPRPSYSVEAGYETPRPMAKPEREYAEPAGNATSGYSGDLQYLLSWWTKANADADSDSESAQFIWPVRGPILEGFGGDGHGERNDGINIAAAEGTPIRAAAAGTVTYAGNELKGYGNLVLIKHADGFVTAYAHAGSIRVSRGDVVKKGEIIGTAGATGDVDRPQLHFEIRHGVDAVNPELYLEQAS